jgi:isochorismatase family protein
MLRTLNTLPPDPSRQGHRRPTTGLPDPLRFSRHRDRKHQRRVAFDAYGAVLHLLRLLPFLCGGQRHLALEHIALRQQLTVYKRTVKLPRLRRGDRPLWIVLAKLWRRWWDRLSISQNDVLRARHVESVMVTGTVTQTCVEEAARVASRRGHRTTVVADAVSSYLPDLHAATLALAGS